MMRAWASVMAIACSSIGCAGDESTPFPPGLDPLDGENRAAAPEPKGDDAHPEELRTTSGELDEYAWVHGRAFVHASIAKTWEAIRDPDVCVDRRAVDGWSATHGVEPQYRYSFVTHNTVNDIVTVRFDVTWRQDVAQRGADETDPSVVAVRWQKTEGTTYIKLMAGSLVARRVDADTTELELVEHLKAYGKGAETAKSTMRDFFASIVAKAHGAPLPTY